MLTQIKRPIRRSSRSIAHALLLLIVGISASSCCTIGARQTEYLTAYECGDLEASHGILNTTVTQQLRGKDYRTSDEAVWLLLDRATVRLAMGDVRGASDDYLQAIEAMDYYRQRVLAEDVGQLVMQDDVKAYAGDDFEQVFARFYAALALLHSGDEGNAFALLRQCEELIQQMNEEYRHHGVKCDFAVPDPTVGKLLFGALLEKRGDHSNAEILYQQVLEASGIDAAVSRDSIRDATLIVLCHNGNMPRKISENTDASVASVLALESFLTEDERPFAMSSLPGIPTPALVTTHDRAPMTTWVSIDEREWQPLAAATYVADLAAEELDSKQPVVAARAIARYVMRRTVVAAAAEQSESAGALADIAMLIANAITQADTRAWGTLPARIDVARFDLEEGTHQLHLAIENHDRDDTLLTESVFLKAGDLCVVNLFNLHPGVSVLQVPASNKTHPDHLVDQNINSEQPSSEQGVRL